MATRPLDDVNVVDGERRSIIIRSKYQLVAITAVIVIIRFRKGLN